MDEGKNDWYQVPLHHDLSLREIVARQVADGTYRLDSLTPAQTDLLMNEAWAATRRPSQEPPDWNWTVWFLCGGRGFGKAGCLDTAVPVPDGWSTLGDLDVGDSVFDESGRPCTVTYVTVPVPADEFKVTFADGTELLTCGDHEWVTWTHAERKAYLRSEYEVDKTRFPDDWPKWRVRRVVGGRWLERGRVDAVLALRADGRSVRSACSEAGVDRAAMKKHLGGFVEPPPPTVNDLGPRVRTTRQIAETLTHSKRGDLNHCVPLAGPLQLPEADLLVDPYILGCWLGDGGTKIGVICKPDTELFDNMAERGGFSKHGGDVRTIYGLTAQLRELGVLGDKHIPAQYLRASEFQRRELLAGLMDTDGGVDMGNYCSYTTTLPVLADQVEELMLSLGYRTSRDVRQPKLSGNEVSDRTGVRYKMAHRVAFTPDRTPFHLARKTAMLDLNGSQKLRTRHRMIVSVEPTGRKPFMRCITVDSPNNMYLWGKAMIPTHNSRTGAETMCEWIEAHGDGFRGACIGPTLADVRLVQFEGDGGILSRVPKSLLATGVMSKDWNRATVELFLKGGGKLQGYSSEVPTRLRGPQHHKAWCVAGDMGVTMGDGSTVRMDRVVPGDIVATRAGPRQVTAVSFTGFRRTVRVTVGGRNLIATGDHKVAVPGGWARARDLEEGDMVCVLDGVDMVRFVTPAGKEPVYDLQVEGVHEFVADGIVVHNCDELASWDDATLGPMNDTTWFHLMAGLRLRSHAGEPQVVVTTTPKPNALIKWLASDKCTLQVARYRGSSMANLANLSDSFVDAVIKPTQGTRMGQQEIDAMIVEDFGDVFDLENLVIVPRVPRDKKALTYVRYWDLASTEPHEGNRDPDWTVGTLAALDTRTHEMHYVVDSEWLRFRPGRRNRKIAEVAAADRKTYGNVPQWFEIDPGAAGEAQQTQLERELDGIQPVKGNRPSGKKHVRAELPAAAIDQGRVAFVEADWNVAAIEQMSEMSTDDTHPHDDFVDTLSGLWVVLGKIRTSYRSAAPTGSRKPSNTIWEAD